VALAVLVVLAVRLVVLLVVRDEVPQREAVVGGDEVDGGDGAPPRVLVEVGRAGEAGGELVERARLPAPEVAHGVPVLAVPLGPQRGEATHLVTPVAEVPGLGDELHLGDDRVLVDDVEEGGQAIHLVELARQGGGEVEAEAVDVHLRHPVTQRVHDELQHGGGAHEEGVPGPGGVEVVPLVLVDEPVVGRVVDPPEGQRGAHVVALGGVVVHHVQDHLDVRGVEGLDHRLELLHLLAALPGGGVPVVRGEEADRVVAPVVREALVLEVGVVDELVHRHQFHGGDTEVREVLDDGGVGHPGVGAARLLGYVRVQHAHALDVGLVDDRVVVLVLRRVVVPPVEVGVHHHGEHGGVHVVGGVALRRVVELVGVERRIGHDLSLDGLGVRVEEELARVAPVAVVGLERPVDAVTVALPGLNAGEVGVPDVGVHLGEGDALLGHVLVEEA